MKEIRYSFELKETGRLEEAKFFWKIFYHNKLEANFFGVFRVWTHDLQIRWKEGVHTSWDREGTTSWPLNGSHWPPEVTILLISTLSKMIWSVYIHQSSRATAVLTALPYQDRLVHEKIETVREKRPKLQKLKLKNLSENWNLSQCRELKPWDLSHHQQAHYPYANTAALRISGKLKGSIVQSDAS